MAARLEVIVGPMFSGKSELLIARLQRALYAGKRIRIVKPAVDTRTQDFIASRAVKPDGTTAITGRLAAVPVRDEAEFAALTGAEDFDVLGVDEAQFFPLDAPLRDSLGWFGRRVRDMLRARRAGDLRIVVAGLDMDFAQEPFGPMPGLMAIADSVEKLTGVCMVCGADNGALTNRLIPDDRQLIIGDAGEYQVRCRACYQAPGAHRAAE